MNALIQSEAVLRGAGPAGVLASLPKPWRAGDITAEVALQRLADEADVRFISPRAMAALSLDLYIDGCLSYEDYEWLAFQPELHPDFDATIGALTGSVAEPDRPRDFIGVWESRLRFERHHPQPGFLHLRRTERILSVLRHFQQRARAAA